jgi:hypothetical protein
LWSVPVLLIAVVMLATYLASLAFGLAGVALALFGVWWLERKADTYVRRRECAEDDSASD